MPSADRTGAIIASGPKPPEHAASPRSDALRLRKPRGPSVPFGSTRMVRASWREREPMTRGQVVHERAAHATHGGVGDPRATGRYRTRHRASCTCRAGRRRAAGGRALRCAWASGEVCVVLVHRPHVITRHAGKRASGERAGDGHHLDDGGVDARRTCRGARRWSATAPEVEEDLRALHVHAGRRARGGEARAPRAGRGCARRSAARQRRSRRAAPAPRRATRRR